MNTYNNYINIPITIDCFQLLNFQIFYWIFWSLYSTQLYSIVLITDITFEIENILLQIYSYITYIYSVNI